MQPDESTTPSVDSSPEPRAVTLAAEAALTPSGRIWGFAVVCGLLAGVVSAGLGEVSFETFSPKLSPETVNGQTSMVAKLSDVAEATRRNAALTYGLMGGVLGLALGVAGGLSRRDPNSMLRAGVVGLVVGLLVSAVASWLTSVEYYRYIINLESTRDESLIVPLFVHIGMWGPCGAAAGLAFGIGLRGWNDRVTMLRGALGGFLGAALAAFLFEILGGIVFPMDKTPQPFAESWMPRALATVLVCLLSAIGAAFVILDASRGRGKSRA